MNAARLWLIGGALAIVGVLAGGWFLGASPLLTAARASDGELESVKQTNALQQVRIDELAAAAEDLPDLQDALEELAAAIPSTGALSAFVGDLSDLATRSGVSVSSLTVDDALLLSDAAAQAAAAAPAVEEAAPAEGEGEATEPGEASAAPVTASLDVPGMIVVPIQLSVTGSLDAVQNFIDAVQKSERYASVSAITISSDPQTGAFRADITGAVYVLPGA